MSMPDNTSRARWQKSSRSGSGNCVEIAVLDMSIAVRDSKASDAGHLTFLPEVWAAFTTRAKAGRYDRDAHGSA
ncbi:hypothetical protein GCM10009736_65930 [Actinomadura bangladeshensis]|uniref:DUF397 domain-containing protein n=2 Tax=Actinomadura bangladeshensis TaxID=453573 RepID=A0A4R4NRD3_9ACTN|nr:DUF397 domain-containing protein [Actinomadura bangladeshensis]